MTFTNALQLLVDQAWVDVTTIDPDVYVGQVINITRGTLGTAPQPTDVRAPIGDPNGTLNASNPMSSLYGKIAQNTPVRVLCDGDVRAVVELSTIVPQWDETDTDVTAQVQAFGVRKRLETGAGALRSALYRSVIATGPAAFWALEDGSGATEAASAVPGVASMSFVGEPQLGQAEAPAGAVSAASFPVAGNTTTARLVVPALPPSLSSTSWTVAFWRRISATSTGAIADGAEWYSSDSTLRTWVLGTLDAPDVVVVNIFSDAGALSPIAPEVNTVDVHDGEWHLFVIAAEQVGSNVEVTLTVDGAHTGSDSGAGTLGKLIGIPGVPRPSGTYLNVTTVGFSGLAIWDGLPDLSNLYDAGNGYLGETAGARLVRVFGEEGIPFALVGDAVDTVAMGPQPVQTLIAIADDCATTDAGILYEPRAGVGGLPGMAYRTRASMYNQAPALELDYGAGHLMPPFRPAADDFQVANDVTASMPAGSQVRYVIPDGDALHKTTEPPPAGVGRYGGQQPLSANVSHAGLLHAAASWHAHVRAWKEQRFPEVTVDLSTDPFVDDPTLAADAAAVDLGDIITVDTSDAPRWTPPDGLLLTVPGIRETLTTFQRRITFVCTPGRPYSVGVLEGSGAPTEPPLRLETAGSQVTRNVTNSATTIRVGTVQGIARWTTDAEYPDDFPLDFDVDGEQITVSAIAAMAAASFINVGTAAHAVNGPVQPGLPAGLGDGDALFVLAAIRNAGTGTIDDLDGYDLLAEVDNLALFGKHAEAGEVAPTVTVSGGVAGADVSAQMCAIRDCSLVVASSATASGTAANITVPAVDVLRNFSVLLAFGWRADDWTSVAPPSGFTEIGEPDTTGGDDQGITWAYRIDTTAASWAGGAFTVTGGASAAWRSGLVVLRAGAQAFTAVRSVNGVLKAHAAGASVRLWRPPVLAR